MKTLNTVPIEQLGGYSVLCECGSRHTIHTLDIIFREGALSELPALAEKFAGKGAKVLVVYSQKSLSIKEKIENGLKDFEVLREVLDVRFPDTSYLTRFASLPEDVRLIIAVGGGALCDTVKYIATALKRSYIVVPDTVKCDAFLSPSCVIYKDGFKEIYKAAPPLGLVADYSIILNLTERAIASAFGSVIGKYISLFDWKFSNIINGEKYCIAISELEMALIDECLQNAEGIRRRERPALIKLIELNLRSGLYMQLAGSSRLSCGGETHIEHALEMLFINEERDLRGYGENIMLCSALIAKVYRLALERDFGNILAPPDNVLRAECISNFLGVENCKAIRKVRPLTDENVLRARRHKLREYRAELLDEIGKIEKNIEKGYRYFRRIYSDAGYSLSEYVDPADFKVVLPLAPDIREKFTLLTMLKDMGLLDAYLAG